jgi:hypothetical protein
MAASLYLPLSYTSFRFLRLTQNNRANKSCFLPLGWRSRTPEQGLFTYNKVDMDIRYT